MLNETYKTKDLTKDKFRRQAVVFKDRKEGRVKTNIYCMKNVNIHYIKVNNLITVQRPVILSVETLSNDILMEWTIG